MGRLKEFIGVAVLGLSLGVVLFGTWKCSRPPGDDAKVLRLIQAHAANCPECQAHGIRLDEAGGLVCHRTRYPIQPVEPGAGSEK